MKLRAVTIEDEPHARERLRTLLRDVDWIECVGEAADGVSAIDLIERERPDLAFLDIQLPELSGLDVLSRITHRPAIIFTTAFDKYAVSAFELQALDYLLKPFGQERFTVAIERARLALQGEDVTPSVERATDAFKKDSFTRIFVRDHGKITPILVRDIERLEAEDDYVAVFSRGRRYLVYLPLAEFEQRLDSSQFLRIHRAHVVNLDFVSHLEPFDAGRFRITMRDGTVLLASRLRSKNLRHLVI